MFCFFLSWGFVREREWPGDPSSVWRPEPDPSGNQTAQPAARYDPGRTASIRICHHGRGGQKGDDRWVGTGGHVIEKQTQNTLKALDMNKWKVFCCALETSGLWAVCMSKYCCSKLFVWEVGTQTAVLHFSLSWILLVSSWAPSSPHSRRFSETWTSWSK